MGVAVAPLFKIDVPSSSKSVRLRPEFPRSKANCEVELGEVFRPASLSASQELGRREVFQVLVIGNNVDSFRGTFEVVSPLLEGFKNR
jgi:hypothetical protein